MVTTKNAKILQLTVFIGFTSLTLLISPVYSCWNCNKFVNKSPAVSMGNATVIRSVRNAFGCRTQTITCQGTYTSTISHIGVKYLGDSSSTIVDDSSRGRTPQITVVCNIFDKWTYNGKQISDNFECSQNPASTTATPTTTTPKPTTAFKTPAVTTKATTTTSTCPEGGKWSDWSNGTACTDTCGNCGTTIRTRTCDSEKLGCPCSGTSSIKENCMPAPCSFPRASCCPPYKASAVKETIICAGGATTTPAPSTKASSPSTATASSTKSGSSVSYEERTLSGSTCPPGGTWSPWSAATKCNDTCGNCGYITITRTCESEKNGCPCEGSATVEECCNSTPCESPRASCCPPFKLINLNGAKSCGINGASSAITHPTTNPASFPRSLTTTASHPGSSTVRYGECCPDNGVWSNWKLVVPCSDSCGSCAKTVHQRSCLSAASGCPCKGEYTKQTRCNTAPCPFPRASCCDNLNATSTSGSITCGTVETLAEDAPMTTTCVPYGGVWSDWSSWSKCGGAPCGACGTTKRTRNCGCRDLNCQCQGPSSQTKACKVVGVWSAWSTPTQCTDTCGGYGNMTRTRTCTTPDCPCSGISTKLSSCAFKPCEPPRQPCNCACDEAKTNGTQYYELMSQNGVNICGPYPMATAEDLPAEPVPCDDYSACTTPSSQPTTRSATSSQRSTAVASSSSQPTTLASTTAESTTAAPSSSQSTTIASVTSTKKACPPGGTWSNWSKPTDCTDTCGRCGTQTRTRSCDSEKDGCTCEGSATETTTCNETPCSYPRDSCCKPFKAKRNTATGKISCMN